jgi:hypothetical protein
VPVVDRGDLATHAQPCPLLILFVFQLPEE